MKPKPDKRVKRQRVKAQQKLSRMARKGKLRKHVRDRVKEMRRQKMAPQEKRMAQIKGDWLIDRSVRERERQRIDDGESEDSDGQLPIDPALISAHFYRNNRQLKNNSDDDQMDEEEMEEQLRTFVSMEEDEERALLPVKINGKLVKRRRAEEEEEEMKPEPFLANEMEEEEEEGSSEIKEEINEVDVAKMSEKELHNHTAKLAAEAENRLAQATDAIVTAPQENVSKFRLLLQMAAGEGESQLVREQLQKLATASLAELFVNVVPGYEIRTLSETEKSQRMKKETKKLVGYEQSLLAYYVKYLRLLEKSANKLLSKGKAKPIDESSFPAQFGFLSVRCMCRLAEKLAHFNYARNILTCLVRLSFSPWRRMLDEICATIGRVFAADRHFTISLHGAKAIAMAVNKKAGYVPAELVATLLALNITEVEQKSTDARMAMNKQKQKQRQIGGGNSRRARKYDKQIGKIDAELKEVVEADTRSAKLKLATETMKYVFLTYCRILKRMSATALLRPVLEGLSKFVHLINVELYDDLARHMGKLVEQKQLKLSEVLLCVRTASVILSGEGQLLDMDLLAFYRALFASLSNICFQHEESLVSDLSLLVESVLLLLVRRRRMVSLARVAAFAKRLALLALPLQSRFQLCLLLLLRRLFIAHSGLKFMIHPEEDEGEGALVASGNFRPDSADPDHSNSMGTVLVVELSLLAKHPNALVRSVAMNLLDGVPATGKHRLDAKWTNLEPAECLALEDPMVADSCAPFHDSIVAYCRDRNRTYCSSNLCSILCDFLRDRGSKHKKRHINDR